MTDWMRIDPNINRPQPLTIGRMTSQSASESPFDVPEAYRVGRNKATSCYVIEIRYLTNDGSIVVGLEVPGVRIFIGKRSNRIRRLEISPELIVHQELTSLVSAITAAIERLESQKKDDPIFREGNYRLAKRAINEKLLNELVAL